MKKRNSCLKKRCLSCASRSHYSGSPCVLIDEGSVTFHNQCPEPSEENFGSSQEHWQLFSLLREGVVPPNVPPPLLGDDLASRFIKERAALRGCAASPRAGLSLACLRAPFLLPEVWGFPSALFHPTLAVLSLLYLTAFRIKSTLHLA